MTKKSRTRPATNAGHFPTGHSGNEKGRPKGSRIPKPSLFEVLEEKTLTVTGPDGPSEVTLQEGLQRRTYKDAIDGKGMPIREVTKWVMKREAWKAKHALGAASRSAITRLMSPDPDNADAALVLLGIAAVNPARADYAADRVPLLLEPWAAQAALSRRRGGNRQTVSECAAIRRCTRDPDSLRWPRGTNQ